MEQEKSHCGGCSGGGCGGHSEESTVEKLALHPFATVGAIYVVVGGKGGVGKSTITALLAANDTFCGKKVGILDADITNPSIHKLLDVPQGVTRDDSGLYPALSTSGIQLMGMGFLTEDEHSLITTKGPVMAGIARQLFTDVCWENVDVLYIDLPSTLADVAEFILTQVPIDGAIVIKNPGTLGEVATKRVERLLAELEIPIQKEIENFGADVPFEKALFDAANSGTLEAFIEHPLVEQWSIF